LVTFAPILFCLSVFFHDFSLNASVRNKIRCRAFVLKWRRVGLPDHEMATGRVDWKLCWQRPNSYFQAKSSSV